jgi:pullulanase
MKKLYFLLPAFLLFLFAFSYPSKKGAMADLPVYQGNDLGVVYSQQGTLFKVWSPQATAVKLRLYNTGAGGSVIRTIDLNKSDSGTWETKVKGDIKNKYYTFQTYIGDKWQLECPDIYARAVGVNGKRGMVVDLADTNPPGWENEKKPILINPTDIILYELHIRDISVSPNSGIIHKGKFLGLTEQNTHSPTGEVTGLAHIKQLGVTHVHLLPSFDFNTIDETQTNGGYNWGYDPLNYNVPEGSYATNPYDGRIRIREFKQVVKTLHNNNLRVIMDVVYNHTSGIDGANFNQFAPGYYYRHKPDGGYSNGTGCGNETASEQTMMHKFMIASVVYWAKEYHVDGFRFDLMGVHDIATMNAISDTLHKLDPTLFIYGEGWDAGHCALPADERALKRNIMKVNKVAAYSDDIRDGLRGPNSQSRGFVSGALGTEESVKFGIVASTQHPQVNYDSVNYSKAAWAKEPSQAINYVSCHDDQTLFDRLKSANPSATESDLIKMDKLANAIVLTSQGVPFIQAGEEFIRTKQGVANSYNSPDSINEIDWARKSKYKAVFSYYQGLIALRKHHPAFRLPSAALIRKHLEFITPADPLVIEYQLKANANGDKWKSILVLLNGSNTSKTVKLPPGNWILAANENIVNEKGIKRLTNFVALPSTSAYVLFQP